VGPDDVCPTKDGRDVGSVGGVKTVCHGGCASVQEDSERRAFGERVGEEAFARDPDSQGKVEPPELVQMCEKRVVFVEAFAEAEAGIEDDVVARDSGGSGGFQTFFEFDENEGKDLGRGERWQMRPVLRAATGVHQDDSAAQFGAGGRHVRVPEMAADVIDDLGPCFNSMLCCAGVEGVDGEDGFGSLFQDGCDNGENAGLLFVLCKRSGVGAGGLAADVEDAGAIVKQFDCLREGAFGRVLGGVEVATVGEGVGCDVQDAHDDRSPSQSEGARA